MKIGVIKEGVNIRPPVAVVATTRFTGVEARAVARAVAGEAKIEGTVVTEPVHPPPPGAAEGLLWYLLPRHRRSEALGDMAEEYAENCRKVGERKARWTYRWDALREVMPTLRWAFLRWSVLVAALAEWLRRTFGS
jgi:hypothetical protein